MSRSIRLFCTGQKAHRKNSQQVRAIYLDDLPIKEDWDKVRKSLEEDYYSKEPKLAEYYIALESGLVDSCTIDLDKLLK